MNVKVKNLCITAMGIALFVVMALAIRFPVFENYYLCLGYVAMAVYLYYFGTVSGTLVGVLGTVLYCVLTSGLRGMPGWTVGNIVIGIILGLYFKAGKKMKPSVFYITGAVVITASTFVGIMLAKSLTECILYTQPMVVRMGKNIYAFVADVVVLILGLLICRMLSTPMKKFAAQ